MCYFTRYLIYTGQNLVMEYIKETLRGIAIMAICWLLYVLYIGFQKLCDKDSKRGDIARFIGKIGSGTLLTYIAICSIVGLIIGVIILLR